MAGLSQSHKLSGPLIVTTNEPDAFHLSLRFNTTATTEPGRRLDLQIHRMHDCDRHDDAQSTVVTWGTPAHNGRILSAAKIAQAIREEGLESVVSRLDCGFLLIFHDRRRGRLTIVNDRTASLPFFYHVAPGQFIASSSFKRLFDARGSIASPGFDALTVVEFLHLRRVFGTRTYDRDIAFLPYASILTVSANNATEHRRYWRITAEKSPLNRNKLAERLAETLRQSMQTYMSDNRQFGLLLSGGLDARALLAAARQLPVCITTTPRPNNELAVAAELAAICGAEHVYVPRPEHLLDKALPTSVALSGGMTIFSEVQFLGYGPDITPKANTIFMGLLLDIMFCGHYLPKSLVSAGGRSGWHFHLHKLPSDFAGRFLDTVSYRLKTSDPLRLFRRDKHETIRKRLLERLHQEIAEGYQLGLREYDLWEFMHLHNLARHYSLLMAQSVRTFAACRLPAITNDLVDLCWAMHAEDKANWAVYQMAITKLNPKLMQVRNANTNIRAGLPLWQQSAIKFARAFSSKIFGVDLRRSPSWWDRSWPEPRQSIDANPSIQARVLNLGKSNTLAEVGLFDLESIAQVISEHFAGGQDHTVLLGELLTIEEALRPS
jgi:asparagine synthase (glutamine-hydrolysing)